MGPVISFMVITYAHILCFFKPLYVCLYILNSLNLLFIDVQLFLYCKAPSLLLRVGIQLLNHALRNIQGLISPHFSVSAKSFLMVAFAYNCKSSYTKQECLISLM